MEARMFDVAGNLRLIDVSRPAPGETPEQRIERLASKALISGVRIVREKRTGLLYATSASDAGTIYALNLTSRSCACDGFMRHGICSHICLALVQFGVVTLTPTGPVTCPTCKGKRGEKISTGGYLSDWVWRTCDTCRGEGTR